MTLESTIRKMYQEDLDKACWQGYKAIGTKKKNGKTVPNCVPEDFGLDEGRMKELHGYIEKGMSAAEIAKKMKLDVKTIKSLMDGVDLDEAPKYDLYHKDFSSAMQHAYKMAKKLHGITIDPKEIDDKVATGPKKPSSGKTNKYRLKGDRGNIQIQVANLDNKKYELNMYKEEVDLDEARKDNYYTVGGDRYDGGVVFTVYVKGKKVHSQILDGAQDYEFKGKKYKNVNKAMDAIAKAHRLKSSDFKKVNEETELDEAKWRIHFKSPRGPKDSFTDTITAKSKEHAIEKAHKMAKGHSKDGKLTIRKEEDELEEAIKGLSAKDEKALDNYMKKLFAKMTPADKEKIIKDPKGAADFFFKAFKQVASKPGSLKFVSKEEVDLDEARGVEDVEHIEMQLRKVISLRGEKPVEFDNREKLKLTPKDAQILIAKIRKIKRPRDKQNMVKFLMKNAKNLKDVLAGKKVETDPEVVKRNIIRGHEKSEDINEAFEAIVLDEKYKLVSARGKDIAKKMMKSKSMKPFAKEVAKMQTVTPDKLEKMVPDYVSGKDISDMFEEVELDEASWRMPKNKRQIAPLLKIMRKPVKLGKEGDDAVEVVRPYIGDDELYDDLYTAGKKNPKGDARPAIRDALQRFGLPWEEGVEFKEELEENYSMNRLGLSPDLVSAVRDVLAGKRPVEETNKNDKSDDGEGLDAVQPKAVKKKFKDRKDKDIDNDGDTDDSDKFLHKKRKAISKAIDKKEAHEPGHDEEEEDDDNKDKAKKAKKDEPKKNGKEKIEINPTVTEEMTDDQKAKREEIVKELKKKTEDFKKKYGDRWEDVMYATATKLALKASKY